MPCFQDLKDVFFQFRAKGHSSFSSIVLEQSFKKTSLHLPKTLNVLLLWNGFLVLSNSLKLESCQDKETRQHPGARVQTSLQYVNNPKEMKPMLRSEQDSKERQV